MTSSEKTVRALIVDDERLGRNVVLHLLETHSDFEVVGQATNGDMALEAIKTCKPDVVFLDIEMPKSSGLQVVDTIKDAFPPIIVFITAHESYAKQAFERRAVDYLLKPFDQSRFDEMIDRVRQLLRDRRDAELGRRVLSIVTRQQPDSVNHAWTRELIDRFVVKEAGRMFFVPVNEVAWLEASGNYVGIHLGGKTHLIHDTLASVEASLNPKQFLRIHRSTVVNVSHIKELQPYSSGELIVILLDGTRLKLSRSYRPRANEILGID